MIQAPSSANYLATSLEQFIAKAEAFLQNHYLEGSNSEDIQKILKAITNLGLDVDKDSLGREFNLVQEKKDYLVDIDYSIWF
jgi:hypothetical protein